MATARPTSKRSAGFTLIELIVVIVISGILATMIAVFIARPIEGSVRLDQRAQLTDIADTALRRIARDVKRALPNSLRSDNPSRIELIDVAAASTYRAWPDSGAHGTADSVLDFSAADSQFNLLHPLSDSLPAGARAAIYSTDDDVYRQAAIDEQPGVISPSGNAISLADDGDEKRVTITGGAHFLYRSPVQRIYFVSGPVSYACAGGVLARFEGYAYQAGQPVDPTTLGATRQVLATNVQSCAFTYVPGTSTRAALLGMMLVLANGDAGTITLLRQVQVENSP